MQKNSQTITAERLRELLSYDPETGVFVWTAPRKGVQVGAVCGRISKSSGYRDIGIDYRLYRAHRLAFLWVTGELPPEDADIDHINRDRADNRFCNLRIASKSQNAANAGKRRHNTSGMCGVVWDKGRQKWRAQIGIANGKKNLGRFSSLEEARAAYERAKVAAFGEFALV